MYSIQEKAEQLIFKIRIYVAPETLCTFRTRHFYEILNIIEIVLRVKLKENCIII